MNRLFKTVLALLTLMASRCATERANETIPMKQDPHSHAAPAQVSVKHLHWKATVNFDKKAIAATATWTIDNPGKADVLILDTRGLDIHNVTLDTGRETTFHLGKPDEILGQALSITLQPDTRTVSVRYSTRPEAEALQWLSPQQTAGKRHPFLFTQSQAILARSWIPCQDTPGVRFTYEADVTVPRDLLAVMSASNPREKNNHGNYHFAMEQPIPSYLLALAVGDLRFKPLSPRSGVYAEDELIASAVWEFADLEKMITGAEELYGPYQWDRYDVLVLPPSFPFGGMENPRLTFATPTILAGDRSLTSLIAHELAHSWSGNLVTNATWNDFWLNEGFTVYFETRIMERLYGKDYAEMLASLNLRDLHDEIASLRRKGQSADTRLKLELQGRNPDDGVTSIAYNKGYYFLRFIEETHGREKFDAFLKNYFAENAFSSMDTETFIAYIQGYYRSAFGISLADSIFKLWIETEGLPENVPVPSSERFHTVERVLDSWKNGGTLDKAATASWSTHEWLHFLKNLPRQINAQQMEEIDDFGSFTESGNAEITTEWGVISIRNQYGKMQPKIEQFLINTGRRKFLSPLYNELARTPEGKERAREIYRKARPNYHFVATNTFDKLLGTDRR